MQIRTESLCKKGMTQHSGDIGPLKFIDDDDAGHGGDKTLEIHHSVLPGVQTHQQGAHPFGDLETQVFHSLR